MERQPWANDLSEILQHGLDLVHHDTGAKRRLALVVVDNFVELLIKTYLSLPSRLTGVKLGRKRFEEVSERFPSLLDALEEHAGNKLDGVSLAEIEWYHQLRNQLYHNGVGLTVERNQVETYAELARLLFHHLLGYEIDVQPERDTRQLGSFLETWARLETVLRNAYTTRRERVNDYQLIYSPELVSALGERTANELKDLRHLRNRVVHGEVNYRQALTPEHVSRLQAIVQEIENILTG